MGRAGGWVGGAGGWRVGGKECLDDSCNVGSFYISLIL